MNGKQTHKYLWRVSIPNQAHKADRYSGVGNDSLLINCSEFTVQSYRVACNCFAYDTALLNKAGNKR